MTNGSTQRANPPNSNQTLGAPSSWLIAHLMQHNPRLLARFVSFRQQLRRLSKGKRRWLARRAAVTLTGAALLLALSGRPAQASSIIVADGVVQVAVDEQCSLIEALENANDNVTGSVHADCTAGNPGGADTVYLGGGFFELNQAHDALSGATGLPVITSEMTIEGEGATITRNPAADPFRIMAVTGGQLALNDTTISGGLSNGGGGGIYALSSSITLNRAIVSGNISVVDQSSPPGAHYPGRGGGIVSYSGDITISSSVIQGNSADEYGGGIYHIGNRFLMEDSDVYANASGRSGGGLLLYDLTGDASGDSLQILRSQIANNLANHAGGGVLALDAHMRIFDSTVSGNTAGGNGGGLSLYLTRLLLYRSTVSDNEALSNAYSGQRHDPGGGGISISGRLVMANSTISGNNSETTGGGIQNGGPNTPMWLDIANSTVVANTAELAGGGMYAIASHYYSSDSLGGLRGTLISGNGASTAPEIFVSQYANIESYGYNVIGHSGVSGIVGLTPSSSDVVPSGALHSVLETTLGDNGGPTLTHALPAGSPAIDLVDEGCYDWLGGVDQRGQPRNIDGDGTPSERECDAGAFEFIPRVDDGDGVEPSVEDGAPNNGDGNYDGIPDSEQSNVTSLPNGANGDYLTIEAPEGTVLEDVESLGDVSPGDAPPNVLFPVGFLSFVLKNLVPGQAVDVNLYLENPETMNAYYKYGPTASTPVNHWYSFAYNGITGAELAAPDRLTLHFVDGERGDSDLTANGTIVDPGGPAFANSPPVVDAGTEYKGDEGSAISLDGAAATDTDGDALSYKWIVDSSLCTFSDDSLLNPDITCQDNGSFTATLSVDDGVNDQVDSNATIEVRNVAPSIDSVTAPEAPVNIGDQPVNVTVTFSDPGTADTHGVTWAWGDTTSDGQAAANSPSGASHTFSEAGAFSLQVTVTDDDGGTGTATHEFVVIYNPEGGFVTGGGWIDSPAGAYKAEPDLTGRANFGFVSKYKKGANVPDGNTEFNFKAGDLNFHSSEYNWLVVNQNGSNAQFKGSGTINGEGDYKFMLWAGDGETDTFRIKIWYESGSGEVVVYDNGFGQPLGGGNIVVHTGK